MYIAFEGIEGSGKSLQIKLLGNFFKKNKIEYILTKEPGSTKIGSHIRDILLSSSNKNISHLTELFLYFADRSQHYEEIIFPNYGKKIIISDRSMYSTFAYQGYARGIDIEMLKNLNSIVTKKLYPDVVILLDCPVEVALKRAIKREKDLKKARFELESIEFHKKVKQGYLKLAENNNWFVVNSELSPEDINKRIVNFLFERYGKDIKNFTKE